MLSVKDTGVSKLSFCSEGIHSVVQVIVLESVVSVQAVEEVQGIVVA